MRRICFLFTYWSLSIICNAQKTTNLYIVTSSGNHLPGFHNLHFHVNGLSGIDQRVGYFFEAVWDIYATLNLALDGYQANPRMKISDKLYKPDGIANTKKIHFRRTKFWGLKYERTVKYEGAGWFESKAKNKNIYSSADDAKQLIGYANALRTSNPKGAAGNALKLFVITTSNMSIQNEVRHNILGTGVELLHFVAYYRYNSSGQMEFLFYHRTYYPDGTYKDTKPIIDIPTMGPF